MARLAIPRVEAARAFEAGVRANNRGQPQEAVRLLSEAALLADAAGQRSLAVQVGAQLVGIHVSVRPDSSQAQRWERFAAAHLDETTPAPARAALHDARALRLRAQGRSLAALVEAQTAAALSAAEPNFTARRMGARTVAVLQLEVGQPEQARATLEDALVLGAPLTAISEARLLEVLAVAFADLGRVAEAVQVARRAVRGLETSPASGPLRIASARMTLAVALLDNGDHEAAERELELVVADYAAHAPASVNLAMAKHNLSVAKLHRGHLDEARRLAEAALIDAEAELGPDSPRLEPLRRHLAHLRG